MPGETEAMLFSNLLLPGLDPGVMELEHLARLLVHEVVVVFFRAGFEAGKSITELTVRGEPGIDQKFERAVHRRITDGGIFLSHPLQEIVNGDVVLDLRKCRDDGHSLFGDAQPLAPEVASKRVRQLGSGNLWIRRGGAQILDVDTGTPTVCTDPEEFMPMMRDPITKIGRDLVLSILKLFVVEFDDAATALADQMVVVVLTERLVAGETLAEIANTRETGADHQLERAVDGGVANTGFDCANALQQFLDADMARGARELGHDQITLTRGLQTLTAKIGPEGGEKLVARSLCLGSFGTHDPARVWRRVASRLGGASRCVK